MKIGIHTWGRRDGRWSRAAVTCRSSRWASAGRSRSN